MELGGNALVCRWVDGGEEDWSRWSGEDGEGFLIDNIVDG